VTLPSLPVAGLDLADVDVLVESLLGAPTPADSRAVDVNDGGGS
jgi:hypothetical protein